MLYREIAVCSQIHTKHINTLCGQNGELYIKTQSVPRSKHSVSVTKNLPLNSAKVNNLAAFCANYMKNMEKLRVQNALFFNLVIFISLC